MSVKRRDFLKIMGVAAAGLGAKSALEVIAPGAFESLAQASASPAPTEKTWAMVVDMRKLTEADCQDAVRACHTVHNVPNVVKADGSVDKQHEIKWIWTEKYENAFPDEVGAIVKEEYHDKPFLLMCNHCTNPPCVRVCPTQATFKRPDGIVMMDMHRCIGCRFCMAGCPYGVRSFNWMDPRPFVKETNNEYPTRTKGVVEKCNFCDERIYKGLKPACVEAVKSGALVFGDLASPTSEVRELLKKNYSIRRKPSLGTSPNLYFIV